MCRIRSTFASEKEIVCVISPQTTLRKGEQRKGDCNMETKFYKCPVCGNVIVKAVDSGMTPMCCGKTMLELKPNVLEEKTESHMPVAEITSEDTVLSNCDPFYLYHCGRRYHTKVLVGNKPHPMNKEHKICFVYYETENGGQIRYLKAGMPAEVCFYSTDKPKAIYSYCNIHGLWKVNLFD